MSFKNAMSNIGKGLSDWVDNAPPTELKLSNIGKPVEVRTWVLNGGGGVENESLSVYAGVLKSYGIFHDGFEIGLDGVDLIEVPRKGYRLEVRAA
jgi:hypothetical protein